MFYPLGIPTCFWKYRKMLVGLLVALLLHFFSAFPVSALSNFSSDEGGLNNEELVESKPFEGGLQEVSPPVGTEKIRERLGRYHPQLSLLSPSQEEILLKGINEKWELVFNLSDWPLAEDAELGLGPHLVVQVDDDHPIRIASSVGQRIVIPMDGLNPGTHRIGAYLAFPWGEALKEPGTSIQSRISFFKKTEGTQPDLDQPWLTVVSPSTLTFKEPLLIDTLIWNAPLQGLKEGDDRWRLNIIINGDSFLMDRQEAIWVKGLDSGTNVVQFQLLDTFGELIDPIFNNQLRLFNSSDAEDPIWLDSILSPNDLFKLLGENDESKVTSLSKDQSGFENQFTLPKEKDDPSIAKYELLFPLQPK